MNRNRSDKKNHHIVSNGLIAYGQDFFAFMIDFYTCTFYNISRGPNFTHYKDVLPIMLMSGLQNGYRLRPTGKNNQHTIIKE